MLVVGPSSSGVVVGPSRAVGWKEESCSLEVLGGDTFVVFVVTGAVGVVWVVGGGGGDCLE